MSNSIGIFNTLIDKISGVKELQYYLNVTNLNIKILLLGETHKTGKCDECFYPSCMSVDIFIYYLALKKQNVLISLLKECITNLNHLLIMVVLKRRVILMEFIVYQIKLLNQVMSFGKNVNLILDEIYQ